MHIEMLVFLLIIIMIILVISLVYASRATTGIFSTKGDPNINVAYTYLAWTVSVLWITLIGMAIGVICLFAFGPELIPTFGKTIVYLIVAVLIIALLAVGIMTSIGAYYIGISAVEPTVKDAYENAIIAAVTALGSIFVALVIGFLVWHYSTPTPVAAPLPTDSPSIDSSLLTVAALGAIAGTAEEL